MVIYTIFKLYLVNKCECEIIPEPMMRKKQYRNHPSVKVELIGLWELNTVKARQIHCKKFKFKFKFGFEINCKFENNCEIHFSGNV